jgi:hypothetical protein
MNDKKTLTVIVNEILWDLDDLSLDEAAEMLKDIREGRTEYSNLRLVVDKHYDHCNLNVVGERLETDEECKDRVKKELSKLQGQKKRKMQQYLKLKEELGIE